MLSKKLKRSFEKCLTDRFPGIKCEVLPYLRPGQEERFTVLVDDCPVFADWSHDEMLTVGVGDLETAVTQLLHEIKLVFDPQAVLDMIGAEFPGNKFNFTEIKNSGVVLVLKLSLNGKSGITGRLIKQSIKDICQQHALPAENVIAESLSYILRQAITQ